MIFVNHIKNAKAAKDYYSQHISPGDYYGRDSAETKGIWHGKGAPMLGLSGEVSQADFFKLCDNINPRTGEQLTPRTKDDRRVLTDFTFDAPKSVSLALEMGGDNGGGDSQILTAMQESVRETMAEIETAVQTRVRKGGKDTDRPTGNMVWAEHVHRTTRPVTDVEKGQTVDPQLHIHATVLNATYDDVEQKWKAIQLGSIVRDKGYYQAAFHTRLAGKLKALGYGTEKDGKSFRLAGIDRSTVEKFSRRTAVIEAEAKRKGIDDPSAKSQLGRKTREKKSKTPSSMSELRAEWDSRLTDNERLALRKAASGSESGDAAITPEQAKEYALEHSFQNASAVSEKRLKAEALTYAVGSIKPEDVADIAQHPEVIARQYDGQLFTTTKAVLKDEVAMLQFAKDGQRTQKPFVDPRGKKWAGGNGLDEKQPSNARTVEKPEEFLAGLSAEQKTAAVHILTSRDQVVGLRGAAGAGKTHLLESVNKVIESGPGDYNRVFAFAQSTTASGELRKVGFKDASTIAMLLKNENLQAGLRKQVILVDEAGLVSSKDMRGIFDIARKQQSRVILVGDYRQHSSIEAGDAFRLIEKEAGIRYAQLKEIRRQTMPGYKKAVEAIAQGTGKAAQKGFDALDKMGWIVEAQGDERHGMLVNDYLKAVDDGKSALIISPTNVEKDRLTEEVRAALKERGAIGKEKHFIVRRSTGWSDAQKGDYRNYEPGMVLEFNQNAKGFKRGEKLVVIEPRERGAENGIGAQENTARRAEVEPGTQNTGAARGQSRDTEALKRHQRHHNVAPAPVESNVLVVLREDGSRVTLPLEHAQRFDVFRAREIGDSGAEK